MFEMMVEYCHTKNLHTKDILKSNLLFHFSAYYDFFCCGGFKVVRIKARMRFYCKWHSSSIKKIFVLTVQLAEMVPEFKLQNKTKTKAIFKRKSNVRLKLTFKKVEI